MIPLLPKWHLMPNRPSFYDTDSKTLLELASTLHASMNNVIEEYNNFVEDLNTRIAEFTSQSEANQENFAVGMRQEFQDFIDTIALKTTEMDNKINGMIADQVSITRGVINEAIRLGKVTIVESYDEETESLNMTATGGV